jgi:hypothetical protein
MTERDDTNKASPKQLRAAENEDKKEVMCWKDPNKVCKCEHPQAGVFCGRFPFPTD